MQVRQMTAWALAAALVGSVACGSPSDAARPAGQAPAAATAGPQSQPTGPVKVDIDAIFPAGPGRDLALNNCQNCHTFVPIVVLQMDEDAWTRNSIDHRPRVTGLGDEDIKTLYAYLKANFNPTRPVPELPQALLDTWTGY